jgi:hypothetical protein
MYKLAAIIGGVLLMAGVALAGAVTSLGSTNSPSIGISQAARSNVRQEDHGREVEERGRANDPGEDLHAAPRLTTTAPRFVVRNDHRGRDHGDRSGRGHGSDDGGHSGHGGHGGDD